MANGDWAVPPQSLTIPPFAGPGQPRTVIGPDIPPELIAFYNVGPASITSAILWYYGNATNTYHYYAVVDLGGGVPPGQVVRGDVLSGLVIQADAYIGADWAINRNLSIVTTPLPGTVVGGDILINGRSLGVIDFQSAVANSAALAAETVIFNSSQTWVNNRCYEFWIDMLLRPGGLAGSATFRLRRINLAGGAYVNNLTKGFTAAGDERFTMVGRLRNTSGADITQNIALTLDRNVGTVQIIASAGNPASWKIQDIGDATIYTNVNAFV